MSVKVRLEMQALILLSIGFLVGSVQTSCVAWPCYAVNRRLALKGKVYSSFQKSIMDCIEESKVNPQLVLKVTSGNWKVKEDRRLKLWAKCLLLKANMISKSGVFHLDVALSGISDRDKTAVESTIDKCLFTTPHAPEETAWHFLKCYHEKRPRYTFL